MRIPSKLLFFLLLSFCLLNLAETLGRSAIPFCLEGRIRKLETRYEVEPGVDDVHLLIVENRVLQIDAELASRLRTGDRISKKPWGRTLQTPRGAVRLSLSEDFRGMAVVMPWLLGVGWLLMRSAFGPQRDSNLGNTL